MNAMISIREDKNKYRVVDGDLQLACFSSKTAAENFCKNVAPKQSK
jgi:hypothetical protein